MCDPTLFRPDSTLAELATQWAGASRVFQRHELDYCCQGKRTLAEACRDRRLPVEELLDELRRETTTPPPDGNWSERPPAQLIVHIVDHYHAGHRTELPRLLAMAEKVERVHGGKPDCPAGLAEHLHTMADALERHMQKEERILFPMLLAGAELSAWAPIQCLTAEHEEHGRDLAQLHTLAHGYVPPAEACGTWRALYLGLAELEQAVKEHIHLENHVLFADAVRGR